MTVAPSRNPPEWLRRAQAMKADGVSQRRIAAAVGAGQEGVKRWLDRYPLGTTSFRKLENRETMTIPVPDWLPRAKALRLEGRTIVDICSELGITETTCGKWLRRCNITIDLKAMRTATKETPPWADKARALHADGASWRMIERELGVSVRLVRKAIDSEYAERCRENNRKYMAAGGWDARMDRQRKAKEAEAIAAVEKPRTAARELRAERFYNYRETSVRWGR